MDEHPWDIIHEFSIDELSWIKKFHETKTLHKIIVEILFHT
jgi:hypothetical protein